MSKTNEKILSKKVKSHNCYPWQICEYLATLTIFNAVMWAEAPCPKVAGGLRFLDIKVKSSPAAWTYASNQHLDPVVSSFEIHGVTNIHLTKADKRTHSNYPHKFHTKRVSTTELKNFFTHMSIPEWNKIPASWAEASTSEIFKVWLAGLSVQSP